MTRHGHLPAAGAHWPGVEIIEAGHPYPDENSVRAAHRALELAADARGGRPSGGAAVGRRLRAARRAGAGPGSCRQAGGDARAAAVGRDDRGDQSRPQAFVAGQGRPARGRRRACDGHDLDHLGRARGRSELRLVGPDGRRREQPRHGARDRRALRNRAGAGGRGGTRRSRQRNPRRRIAWALPAPRRW